MDQQSQVPPQPWQDVNAKPTSEPLCPYLGLSAFTENKESFFFGRDKFVKDQLVNKLPGSTEFLAVVGSSGSGKSSVVQAGIFPKLQQGKVRGFTQNVPIFKLRPSNENIPEKSLLAAFFGVQDSESEESGDVWVRVQQQLKQLPSRSIIFIDQFEELFALFPNKQEAFVRELDNLLKAVPQVTLIITMRSDFYEPLQNSALGHFLPQHQVNVQGELEEEDLRTIITKPAEVVGLKLEEGLVDLILTDLKQTKNPLPLLEFTLEQLWKEEHENNLLTCECYLSNRIGRVTGAIAVWANDTYRNLPNEEEKELARRIFTRLIHYGSATLPNENSTGIPDTRCRLPLTELIRSEEERTLIKKLADARLLVTDNHTVEIIHDALITEWTQLSRWINEKRAFWLWRQQLDESLREWQREGKKEEYLLYGARVAEAEDYLKNNRAEELNKEERDYIEASVNRRDHQEKERQEQKLSTISILTTSAQELFDSNKEFDALLASLNAAKEMKQAAFEIPSDLQFQVKVALQQSVYWVKERNRLEGHKARVVSVSYSPDGKTLASASGDTTVKLWDVATGKEVSTLTGHKAGVFSVSYSPNGKTLASASTGDKTVKLWDVATGEEIFTFSGYAADDQGNNGVSFSPDGQLLAFASERHTIQVWDVATCQQIATLTGHGERVNGVSLSPDGRLLASASFDGTVKLWDVTTRKEIPTNIDYGVFLGGVSFSPDGRLLAGGGNYGIVKLWDVATRQEIPLNFSGFKGRVTNLSFSPNGQLLVASGFNNAIKLWDVATGIEMSTLTGHLANVNNVKFSPDGQWLASASNDHSIKLWYIGQRQEINTLSGHKEQAASVSFSPDGRLLASGSWDQTVKLWDVATGQKINTPFEHTDWVSSVSFSPDGRYLASGSWDQTVKLWDVATGQEINTFSGHKHWVRSVSFSPDGKCLASCGWDLDKTVKLWDVATGIEIRTLTGHRNAITAVSFSPDGRLLASASLDQTIKQWDVATGVELATLIGHKVEVNSVSFSPDGRLLASAGDTTIKLWDVATGIELATLIGHKVGVNSVSFSPDTRLLASASNDHTIILWDVATRKKINIFNARTEVYSISFSPDGRLLASGGSSGTVILWNLKVLLNLTLEDLAAHGCDWVSGYLQTNPNVSNSYKQLCNGISTAK